MQQCSTILRFPIVVLTGIGSSLVTNKLAAKKIYFEVWPKLEVTNCDLNVIAMNKKAIALVKQTESKIQLIRGQKVILDADLAALYGVPVRQLNQQIKRNFDRFPADFLFRLSHTEYENLRSQFVISSSSYGGRRYLPYAFTEHGAIMAATVLNSERAVEMSIFVVRAFVRMREALTSNQKIVSKLGELERRLESHDSDIQQLIEAIRELMTPPEPNRRKIGFEFPASQARAHGKKK